jgi:hypothetical protein
MTNFWWVNQNGSYQHDIQLGILWAPLLNKRGHRASHWESLEKARPGDVVFHYSGQQIKAVSCVSRASLPATRPYAGGESWHRDGRCVQTVYAELDVPLPLRELPSELRKAASFKGSAFSSDGSVNEGYFFHLSEEFGLWLSDRLGLIAEETEDASSPTGSASALSAYYDETNRSVVVNARREQSMLRDALFKDKSQSECAVCGRVLPVDLLTAAHIKKRSDCETSERNDPNVVMAACNLGCDALFEKRYIVVDENGVIQAGDRTATGGVSIALKSIVGRKCSASTPLSSIYFDFHRAGNAGLVVSVADLLTPTASPK